MRVTDVKIELVMLANFEAVERLGATMTALGEIILIRYRLHLVEALGYSRQGVL